MAAPGYFGFERWRPQQSKTPLPSGADVLGFSQSGLESGQLLSRDRAQGGAQPDSRTGAYCQARVRLPLAQLKATHEHLAQKLTAQTGPADHWLGRRVKVIDGTGLSMPDTAANQKVWPQPTTQNPGCGFPVVKLVACFCLASGALLHWVQGTLKEHDCRLLQKLLEVFQQGDVVLADRGFSSFANLAVLLARGVDAVLRLHHFRKLDWRVGRRLGPRDRLVRWSKGPFQGKLWTRAQWEELPAHLDVRVVESRLSFKGTVDALRQWQELFEGSRDHPRRVGHLRQMFYEAVAGDPLLVRAGRSEPRAVKRRPKNFRLLTKPRAQMIVERSRKQSQKPSKNALN